MDSVFSQAFAEVLEVLNNSEKSIISKIPENFIELLKKYKDSNYNVEIDFSNQDWDDNVKKETQAILALIYRDYIVSKDEREKLLAEEKEEQIKIENELREKYNTDNLFKNRTRMQEDIGGFLNEKQLVVINDKPWYKRIFEKLKNIFRRA